MDFIRVRASTDGTEVPEWLRERVGERFPHAPERWSGPNMTSWTAYADRADKVGR
jgi:hypothetical protein